MGKTGKNQEKQRLPPQIPSQGRIFGLSSASQAPRFDVGEDFPDDLPEIGRAQRAAAEVVAVAPAGRDKRSHSRDIPEEFRAFLELQGRGLMGTWGHQGRVPAHL